MDPKDLDKITRHWSGELGCAPGQLLEPGFRITAHPTDYRGARVFRTSAGLTFGVPPAWRETVRERCDGADPQELFETGFLAELFGDGFDRTVGPAFLGYLGGPPVQPDRVGKVRRLTSEDEPAVLELQAACTPLEWDYGGPSSPAPWPDAFGVFEGKRLVAFGNLESWGPDLLDLGVVTHPDHRGRGLGRSVAYAMTGEALERGKVPQYRTLYTNEGSMGVARALGYTEWARMLAIRLLRWEP